MAELSYRRGGLTLRRGGGGFTERQARDLQRDLRRLGYLKGGIDGIFGRGTERAVKALQYDLLANDGRSTANDGRAPVRVLDFNLGRVVEVTGVVDAALADCISDMLDEKDFSKLPHSLDPVAENRRIVAEISGMRSREVPIPFLLGILRQESNLKHYREPRGPDEDNFIVVGLDTNASRQYVVTSRGYGVGQFTLFHHPPRPEEVNEFMGDVSKNLRKAVGELREKFDHFINGHTYGTQADDRIVEYGRGPLRSCKYGPEDSRYMTDCKNCLQQAGTLDIVPGVTPFFEGSSHTYSPTQYYKRASYLDVPIRKNIGCDWPYAVRRYNGSGINSYHYQSRVLKHMLSL